MLHTLGLLSKGREGFSERAPEVSPLALVAFAVLLSIVSLLLMSWLTATLWNVTLVPLTGFKKANIGHGILLKLLVLALLL